MISAVYIILCSANDRIYVGSTTRYTRRIYDHKRKLRYGTHVNMSLQEDYNKYGEEYFIYTIIEECSEYDLVEKEKAYVEKLLAENTKLYNAFMPGHTAIISSETLERKAIKKRGSKHSEETKRKMSEAKKDYVPWNKGMKGGVRK